MVAPDDRWTRTRRVARARAFFATRALTAVLQALETLAVCVGARGVPGRRNPGVNLFDSLEGAIERAEYMHASIVEFDGLAFQ
jgi:hypothetical protein